MGVEDTAYEVLGAFFITLPWGSMNPKPKPDREWSGFLLHRE
jgi:hypothetical protein